MTIIKYLPQLLKLDNKIITIEERVEAACIVSLNSVNKIPKKIIKLQIMTDIRESNKKEPYSNKENRRVIKYLDKSPFNNTNCDIISEKFTIKV